MRRKPWIAVLLVAGLFAGPAVAEEIIHFTNGTQLPIRNHKVVDDMVHVDLGDDAFMAFPMAMVDRIEEAGKDVMLLPSSPSTNKMIEVAPGRSAAPQRASTSSRFKGKDPYAGLEGERDPAIAVDNGVAVYKPYADGPANKRKIGYAGHQRVFGQAAARSPRQGMMGASRVGTGYKIAGDDGPRAVSDIKPVITGFELRSGFERTRGGSQAQREQPVDGQPADGGDSAEPPQ